MQPFQQYKSGAPAYVTANRRYLRSFSRGPKPGAAKPYHKRHHPAQHPPFPSLKDPYFCRHTARWLGSLNGTRLITQWDRANTVVASGFTLPIKGAR